VKLEVFDLQGRLIKTLANGAYEAGTFSIAWAHTSDSGQPVRPGIYMYRMIAGGFRAQEKMLLLP
jgi:flagellar hook assembly protein FlgD